MKKIRGFSLIELLVSLIVISLIATAFAPVLTKKLKYQSIPLTTAKGVDCSRFDPDGRCLACAQDKCLLCSTQMELEEGKYVNPSNSCDVKDCSIGCSTCDDTSCSACSGGYGWDSTTKICQKCTAGTSSPGGSAECVPCAANFISAEGKEKCTECKASEHKVANASKTACENVTCSQGQYIENATCKTCPSNTYQESENHQLTSCLPCPSGSYCENGQKITCSANCAACSSPTTCTSCSSGYVLAQGKCVQTGDCYVAGNICIAKFNAGDTYIGGLEIPDGLVTKYIPAATSSTSNVHTNAYCWMGNSMYNTVTACNANNGGYSGCTRTVCTWAAAKKICEYHGWRLPTKSELSSFSAYSISLGTNGLQLCDRSSGYSSAQCQDTLRCPGSYNGYCNPDVLWSSEGSGSTYYYYRLHSGVWDGPYSIYASYAFSVRCVRDL